MQQKQIISLGAVLVVLVAVIGLSLASYAATGDDLNNTNTNLSKPNRPDFNSQEWQQKKTEMDAKRQAVISALDAGDYQAWLEAVGADSPIAQSVSEDEFPRLIEAHKLMQEGQAKFEQARQIQEDIGIPGPGDGGEFRKGPRHGMMMPGMGFAK